MFQTASRPSNRTCKYSSLQTLFFVLLAVQLVFTSLTSSIVQAKRIDRNSFHGHRGALSTYKPGPFETVLDTKDEKTLSKGDPVMKQLPADDGSELGGKAICIQDVAAPKKAVWNQILDIDHYKEKVNKLKECKNYFLKANSDGTVRIKTKMVIGVMPGYAVRIQSYLQNQKMFTIHKQISSHFYIVYFIVVHFISHE